MTKEADMSDDDDKVLEVDEFGNETTQADLDEALAAADRFTAEDWRFARQFFVGTDLITHRLDTDRLMRRALGTMYASRAIFIVTCVKGRVGIEHAPPDFFDNEPH
jgi:hypothetical protein